jgi:hypothetical protein
MENLTAERGRDVWSGFSRGRVAVQLDGGTRDEEFVEL